MSLSAGAQEDPAPQVQDGDGHMTLSTERVEVKGDVYS